MFTLKMKAVHSLKLKVGKIATQKNHSYEDYFESDKNRTLEIAAVIFAVNPGTTIYVDNVVIFSEKT